MTLPHAKAADPAGAPLVFLFCANSRFFRHFAVALASLVASNPEPRKKVYLITCDADAGQERRLAELAARHERLELEILHARADLIADFPVSRHITAESYLRIVAPLLLPADVDRVLYLDSDLVVVGDLRALWNIDLSGKALAAAPDYPWYPDADRRRLADQIGFPATKTYVNAGVALLNLAYWREHGVMERTFAFVRARSADLWHHDQDALNVVLQDEIRLIDYRWNVQAPIRYFRRHAIRQQFDETVEARRNPAIIHYSGSQKPWGFRARVPWKRVYRRYARAVDWPDNDVTDRLTGPARLEYAMDSALSALGLDYMQAIYLFRRAPIKIGEGLRGARRRKSRSGVSAPDRAGSRN